MNYDEIKEIAKEHGMRVSDLIALAPANDPFYVGTPKDMAQARWFDSLWRMAGFTSAIHMRRLHYWADAQVGLKMHDGKIYENDEKCWRYLLQASKVARYLGLVRFDQIVDHKHPDPYINAYYGEDAASYEIATPDLSYPDISIYGIHHRSPSIWRFGRRSRQWMTCLAPFARSTASIM